MQRSFLIAISILMLAGCSNQLPKFPADFIYEVDLQNKVCAKYPIIDHENLKVGDPVELPLSECNGVFGFSSTDIAFILDWSENAIEKAKKACK